MTNLLMEEEISADRKVIYYPSICHAICMNIMKIGCLGECAYYDPQSRLIPSNCLIAMYLSESSNIGQHNSGSLMDPNGPDLSFCT